MFLLRGISVQADSCFEIQLLCSWAISVCLEQCVTHYNCNLLHSRTDYACNCFQEWHNSGWNQHQNQQLQYPGLYYDSGGRILICYFTLHRYFFFTY